MALYFCRAAWHAVKPYFIFLINSKHLHKIMIFIEFWQHPKITRWNNSALKKAKAYVDTFTSKRHNGGITVDFANRIHNT